MCFRILRVTLRWVYIVQSDAFVMWVQTVHIKSKARDKVSKEQSSKRKKWYSLYRLNWWYAPFVDIFPLSVWLFGPLLSINICAMRTIDGRVCECCVFCVCTYTWHFQRYKRTRTNDAVVAVDYFFYFIFFSVLRTTKCMHWIDRPACKLGVNRSRFTLEYIVNFVCSSNIRVLEMSLVHWHQSAAISHSFVFVIVGYRLYIPLYTFSDKQLHVSVCCVLVHLLDVDFLLVSSTRALLDRFVC